MKSNRRSFLKASSLAVASFTTACAASAPSASAPSVFDPPFSHHVLFWMKDPRDQSTYAEIVRSLREFRAMEEVKFLHVGAPTISDNPLEASATDATYTISYLTLFESMEDKENYLKSPLHARFFDRFKDAFSKVVIYDSLRVDE